MSSGDLTRRVPGEPSSGASAPPSSSGPDGAARTIDLVGAGLEDPATPEPPPERRAELRLPSEARSLRLARLVVAGVAADLGFTVDEVEDLRVAVDEACGAVMSSAPSGAGGHLHLVVDHSATPGAPRIEVATWSDPVVPPLVDAVPALLLEHTTDGWSATDGRLRFWRTGAVTRG